MCVRAQVRRERWPIAMWSRMESLDFLHPAAWPALHFKHRQPAETMDQCLLCTQTCTPANKGPMIKHWPHWWRANKDLITLLHRSVDELIWSTSYELKSVKRYQGKWKDGDQAKKKWATVSVLLPYHPAQWFFASTIHRSRARMSAPAHTACVDKFLLCFMFTDKSRGMESVTVMWFT